MPGVVSIGTYLPYYRLSPATLGWPHKTSRLLASHDQDSLTLALEASRRCLLGFDRAKVDAVLFVSSSPPFIEKLSSSILAAGLRLKSDVLALDVAGSLGGFGRALSLGLGLIESNRAAYVLIATGDKRRTKPLSQLEATNSDAGAAVLLGPTGEIASVLGEGFFSSPILDAWQLAGEPYLRDTEERFVQEQGYTSALPRALDNLLKKTGLTNEAFSYACIATPEPRRLPLAIKTLKLKADSLLGEGLSNSFGFFGNSSPLFLLNEALLKANPGELLLLAGYGDGAFSIALKAADGLLGSRPKPFPKVFKDVPSYTDALKWHGAMEYSPQARRPPIDPPSPIAMYRESEQNLALVGVRCKACGYPQYPPQRLCTRCRGMDFEKEPFADKRARLFTYALDTLGPTPEPPLIVCFIDFEGGGRMQCLMSDADPKALKVGMPLEMSFRRLFSAGGIPNYFWKCTPLREG
jgi:3-hydroxy-3-methylglutaryl CoA synthase/uncharacterized OB-fold protein